MIDKIAFELGIRPNQVKATVDLLDEGATVPFISRYRKERTGDLDEVQIMNVRDRITQLRELDKRREAILKSIEDQGTQVSYQYGRNHVGIGRYLSSLQATP